MKNFTKFVNNFAVLSHLKRHLITRKGASWELISRLCGNWRCWPKRSKGKIWFQQRYIKV